jgi:hypothetical protein
VKVLSLKSPVISIVPLAIHPFAVLVLRFAVKVLVIKSPPTERVSSKSNALLVVVLVFEEAVKSLLLKSPLMVTGSFASHPNPVLLFDAVNVL